MTDTHAHPARDAHAGHDHDHAGHDHSGHDHAGHDHSGHDHSHLPTGPDAGKRMLSAMALTGGFLIAEVIGGVLSGSLALLADAAHMVTDVAALALGYAGLRLATRAADPKRSFGYARFEVLASFTNGIALLALSAWIVFEAATRFFDPIEVLSTPMLVIAVLGLLVNIASFLMLSGGAKDNLNVRGALIHVIGDLLGSVATIMAALVIMWTGWMPIDPLLSALVALLVVRSGWDITRRSAHILLEGTPEAIDREEIRRDLCGLPGVAGAYHIHVWSLTTGRMVATLHIMPAAGFAVGEVVATVRRRLQEKFGIAHSTIEVDPDGPPDGAEEVSCGA